MNKITNISASTLKKATPVVAPKDFFGEKIVKKLLSQALHVQERQSHTGIVTKKTRSEVSRTKAKWYKQKGTGGARHGAKSANIFVGGGLVHGPSGAKRPLHLPKAIAQKALNMALTQKLSENKVYAVSNIESVKKTKAAAKLINSVSKDKKFILALSPKNKKVSQFFKNLPNTKVYLFQNLNARKVVFGGTLIIDLEVFKIPKK